MKTLHRSGATRPAVEYDETGSRPTKPRWLTGEDEKGVGATRRLGLPADLDSGVSDVATGN